MPAYKVTLGSAMYFVVNVPTRRNAYSEAIEEWGRGCGAMVERATQEDIDAFKQLKGADALSPMGEY